MPRWGWILFVLLPALSAAQSASYQALSSDEPLQDRIAYLITVLQSDPTARSVLESDPAVAQVSRRVAKARDSLEVSCKVMRSCPIGDLMLTDAEVRAISDLLAREVATGRLVPLVRNHLRPSGRFQQSPGVSDAELIRRAWERTARGVNRVYSVYGLEEPGGIYASIDGPLYDPDDPHFRDMWVDALDTNADAPTDAPALFSWVRLACALLRINQRDEAARYEPLESGENRSAAAIAKSVRWDKAPYAAIVLPGTGLEDKEIGLSPIARFGIEMGVKRWRRGEAPFILVSGGHVHPNRTVYCEAIEMKRELMHRFDVPESAIIVDPYARHTTTNLRNAVRLLFRFGAPADKPMLVVSSSIAIDYIASAEFEQRNQNELGFRPIRVGKRTAAVSLEAIPNLMSLQEDPMAPLDP